MSIDKFNYKVNNLKYKKIEKPRLMDLRTLDGRNRFLV